MKPDEKSQLETELGELFDIRTAKLRREKTLNEDFLAAQKEVHMLILMFTDGIPSMTIPLGDNESLEWDEKISKLLYHKGELTQFIESVSKSTLVSIRPHLRALVRKAKDFYRD